ncbi:MAG: glutamyl-tRNA reductase, partial [Elusimicrobia bacterium RIFCSPHIGHO2_01_FULL_64_10]
MPLIVVGLSHKTAPVELREKLSFAAAELAEAGQSLARARDQVPLSEAILLSTCNRTEIYGLSNADARGWCLDFLRRRFQRDDLGKYVYVKEEREMVGHLFSVASGLDSLVYGENEILKQVKDAYHLFHGLGLTGKVLNVLFQRALYVGKLVRTHTAINQGALSVGSVAVSLAEKIFGDLSKSTVLIFGAGKMAEVSARYLLGKKVRTLLVANRTLENARTLAEKFDGTPLTLEDGLKNMIRADVVLTSASVTEPLIRPDFLAGLMLRRQNRSLFLI